MLVLRQPEGVRGDQPRRTPKNAYSGTCGVCARRDHDGLEHSAPPAANWTGMIPTFGRCADQGLVVAYFSARGAAKGGDGAGGLGRLRKHRRGTVPVKNPTISTIGGYWTDGGKCRIRIYQQHGGTPVVICSQLPDKR